MNARVGQAWEIKSYQNGERIFVVMESRPTTIRHGGAAMVHKILQITGKKMGRVLICTEPETALWETQSNMLRLDV